MDMKEVHVTAEQSFFINTDGNIEYCAQCNTCAHECKQSYHVTIVCCKQYTPLVKE